MKRILVLLLSFAGLGGLLMQCSKVGRDLDVTISPVQNLFAPNDNLAVTLQPATSAVVVFQWDQARAQDGTLVLYEVAFAPANGDFSKPVFKMPSDQNGVQAQATISHKDLNRIAALAGAGSMGTVNLKWTVQASRGINVQTTAASRTITLTRPAGFDVIPNSVFLTGSATEAGTDVTKALAMKSIAPGVYEIYTSLKAGTYNFTDGATTTAKTYSINGVNIREGGSATVTGAQQPVRIRLDFANAAATVTQIQEMGFWYSNQNSVIFTLDYAGGGQWRAANKAIKLDAVPWGKEDRYKFQMKTSTGGTAGVEQMGSANSDNSPPNAQTPPTYFYLFPIQPSQWDYSFKFPGGIDGKTADINVSLAPTATNYTHSVSVK